MQMARQRMALCADFRGGYAEGWVYRVPAAFRDALGIEWAQRMVNGAPSWMWVQVPALRFKRGDLLHRGDGAGAVQVLSAEPGSESSPGAVTWLLFGAAEVPATEVGTQDEFCWLLKYGFREFRPGRFFD